MQTTNPNRGDTDETPYVTPSEASRLTGLNVRTLARLADRGELAAYELPSGHRRYLRTSIEEFTQPRRRSA